MRLGGRGSELNRAAEINYGEIPTAEAAIEAAAARLGITLRTVYRFIDAGDPPPTSSVA